jgi:hypothetical protein
MYITLPTLVPWCYWGETFLHSLHVAAFLRCTTGLHIPWLVNSAAHLYGHHPMTRTLTPKRTCWFHWELWVSQQCTARPHLVICQLGYLPRSQREKVKSGFLGGLLFCFGSTIVWMQSPALVGKCSTTWVKPPCSFCFIFLIVSHFFPGAAFWWWSSYLGFVELWLQLYMTKPSLFFEPGSGLEPRFSHVHL